MESERKTVQIFNAAQALNEAGEEKLRERIKKGIESGILILDPGAVYVGYLQYADETILLTGAAENAAEGIAIEAADKAKAAKK